MLNKLGKFTSNPLRVLSLHLDDSQHSEEIYLNHGLFKNVKKSRKSWVLITASGTNAVIVFRHNVLSVVNSHMGLLLAKFRANFFMKAWNPICSFLIFQQFSRSQLFFFPESNHPSFQLHVTNITHHVEEQTTIITFKKKKSWNQPSVPNLF